jgi:hypothetical protein
MATIIKAGNATDGLALTADNTGILELKTGTGSGTTALTLDASQNATFAGTVTTVTGAVYPLVSGTAVASTSGTSITFTGIPSTAKRITVMFQGVSLSGTSSFLVQIGSGSVTTTGYISSSGVISFSNTTGGTNSTAGFLMYSQGAANTMSGNMVINTLGSNIWVSSNSIKLTTANVGYGGGDITLGGVLDRVRITTVNGTDTFDAGTINILWE